MAKAQDTQNQQPETSLLSPARYNAPPGPPVALGAALAIWLFAQTELSTTLMALLVTALVGIGYVRARKEAHSAKAAADEALAKVAEYEFILRTSSRLDWSVDHGRRSVRGEAIESLLGRAITFDEAARAAPAFIHPEDCARMARAHDQCLAAGETDAFYVRLLDANGAVKLVKLRMRARRDAHGALSEMLFVASDITAFHDRGLQVAEMIAAAERQLAETRPELDELMQRLGLEIVTTQVAPDIGFNTFGEGQHFQQASERFTRVLREWEARRAGFTNAVAALQEARAQTEILSQAASHSADAIIIYDSEGLVEWVNPAFEAMTGHTLDEARGKTSGALLCGPDTNRADYAAFRARVARGESAACEIINYTKAGAPFWVDMRGARVLKRNGQLKRTIAVQRDLTARRGMEDELRRALSDARQASAAKSQFVANMSHELRTPLNAVIGYTEILEEDLEAHGLHEQARDADTIRTAARRLLGLINEVLDLSRIEGGRMDVLPSEADFAAIAQEAIAANRALAEANGNVIVFTGPSAPVEGFTDIVKLRQCLSNLISNACKFTHNGRVEISLDASGAAVRFTVKDTGIGLSAAQQARLFQPFVQADSAASRKFEGAGLGLVITRRLAQLLGGDVTAHSVEGEGATFMLSAAQVLADRGEEGVAVGPDRPRILVIEDDPSALDLSLRTMERLGFVGIAATTAAEGLRLARTCEPALILLDVGLPDNDGWSVLTALNGDEGLTHAPVVIVTAEEHRARAERAGAAAYLQKPVGRDILAATVARLARQRPSLPQTPAIAMREAG